MLGTKQVDDSELAVNWQAKERDLTKDKLLGKADTAAEKIKRLHDAGITVAEEISEIPDLVKEKIGDSGVQALRDAGLEVELGADWEDGELERRIGEIGRAHV